MSIGWRKGLVLGLLLSATMPVANAASWLYAGDFVCTGEAGDPWQWILAEGQQAQFSFDQLPRDVDVLVLDLTVCIPRPGGDAQEIMVRVRGLTGRWISFRVPLQLAQSYPTHPVYTGQLLVSRRALGLGSTMHVALEQGHWRQAIGTHGGSVRLMTATAPSGEQDWSPVPRVIQVVEHDDEDTQVTWEGVFDAAGRTAPSVEFARNGVLEARDHRVDPSDWDWYRLNLDTGKVLYVRVQLATGASTLEVVDPYGRVTARVHGGTELHILYRPELPGNWYVRLQPGTPQATPYTIMIRTHADG